MKAKKIFENLEFERRSDPKESMGIGWDGKVYNFLKDIKRIIDEGIEDGYESFFNTGDYQYEDDPEKMKVYHYFVDNWEHYVPIMREIGIDIEDMPDYEETVFALV
jgi:hypothetical protein